MDKERIRQQKNAWAKKKYHENIEASRAKVREANRLSKRRWRDANPGLSGERSWKFTLKKFGMTIEDYNRILFLQCGVCAICKRVETATTKDGIIRRLNIDHDNATGRVRGLLCRACNVGIGQLKHELGILGSAIMYLERAPYEYGTL